MHKQNQEEPNNDIITAEKIRVAFIHKHENAHAKTKEQIKRHSLSFYQDMNMDGKLPFYLQHNNEDVTSLRWRQHKKHIFILSDAGKPIFSRYGNEDDLSTMMGLLMAIVSFIYDDGDEIKTIYAGDHKIIFVVKGPLCFVTVSSTVEPENELILQLDYIYRQLIFILTEMAIEALRRRSSFDLRDLLGGTDSVIHSLIHVMTNGLSFSLKSIRCLPMSKQNRNQIGDLLIKYKTRQTIFSILLAGNHVIQIAKSKRYTLYMEDLLLLMNFVHSNAQQMKSNETWTPICLPLLSSRGYVYAYIHYLNPMNDICLIMVCLSNDQFFECSASRKKLEQVMKSNSIIEIINEASAQPFYLVSDLKIEGLRHFVYRIQGLSQFTTPAFTAPYSSEEEKERLVFSYKTVRENLNMSTSPQKMYFFKTNKESLLGWQGSGVELYAALPPTISKQDAVTSCEQIKKWIKKHEDSIFIQNFPQFS